MTTQQLEVCKTREELTEKYFSGLPWYNRKNLGIVTLLSDTQEVLSRSNLDDATKEHYRRLLNDVKAVLIHDGGIA